MTHLLLPSQSKIAKSSRIARDIPKKPPLEEAFDTQPHKERIKRQDYSFVLWAGKNSKRFRNENRDNRFGNIPPGLSFSTPE